MRRLSLDSFRYASFLAALALMLIGASHARSSEPTTTFFQQFEATIQPHGWQGFLVAPSTSENCVYLARVIPLEPSTNGASVKDYFMEPEYDGKTWNDVIRIVLPPTAEKPLKVRVVIYKISGGDEPIPQNYNGD